MLDYDRSLSSMSCVRGVNNDPAGGIGNVTIARKQGVFGSKFLPPVTWSTTKWVIGSTAEVEWGIAANHGGGYQYRLCPADQELNEEGVPLASDVSIP